MKKLTKMILTVVASLHMQSIAANQTPSPPVMAVPDFQTSKVTVMCVDCGPQFNTETHKELLRGLAKNPYIAQLRKALFGQDILHQFESKAHFDNCDFISSTHYIESLWNETGEHVKQATAANIINDKQSLQEAVEKAFYSLGQILHAVQDFYAHTNYIELQAPKFNKITDVEVITPWRQEGRELIISLQTKGLISGVVFWGFPQICPSGTPSHSKLAKDSSDSTRGSLRIPHMQNISLYSASVYLAREASLALISDAYKQWPILMQVNGPYVAFETIVDRRSISSQTEYIPNKPARQLR